MLKLRYIRDGAQSKNGQANKLGYVKFMNKVVLCDNCSGPYGLMGIYPSIRTDALGFHKRLKPKFPCWSSVVVYLHGFRLSLTLND